MEHLLSFLLPGAAETKNSVSFIEILNPLDADPITLEQRTSIIGYADFESFWGNSETPHWVDNKPY